MWWENLLFWGAFLARLLVGLTFLVAGAAKLKGNSDKFLNAIMGYELVPRPAAVVLTYALPWVEVAVGGLLIAGLWSRWAAMVGALLLLFFSAGIVASLLRHKDNECGCFRSLTPVQWRLIYRNLVLLGLLIPVYVTEGGLWSIGNGMGLQIDWASMIDLAALIVVWLLVLVFVLLLHLTVKSASQTQKM